MSVTWSFLTMKPFRPMINLQEVKNLPEYDVMSFIHRMSFINKPYFLRYVDLPILAKKAGLVSYTALGCDKFGYLLENPLHPYRPCTACERFDKAGQMIVSGGLELYSLSRLAGFCRQWLMKIGVWRD